MPAFNNKDLPNKLLLFFNKISHGSVKGVDESYLDRLLTSISSEAHNSKTIECIVSWFREVNLTQWHEIAKDATRLNFLIQLFGVLCKEEVQFITFMKNNVVDAILCPSFVDHQLSAVRSSYVAALTNVLAHRTGRDWIKHCGVWKSVIKLSQSDCSVYVQRRSREFTRLLLSSERCNEEFSKQVTEELLQRIFEAQKTEVNEEQLEKNIAPVLKILTTILEDCIAMENANALPDLLIRQYNVDDCIKKWAATSSKESLLDTLVTAYGTMVLTSFTNKGVGDVSGIMDLYSILLNGKHICAVLTLSRVCHMIYVRLSNRLENPNSKTEMHFLLIELMPILVSLRKRETSYLLDQYVNQLIDQASEETFRMGYRVRDVIREQDPEVMAQKATRTVHGVMAYHHTISRDTIVIIFKTLVWLFKNFVPTSCEDLDADDEEVSCSRALCDSASPLLCALLQSLCALMNTYHISWSEAFEGLCLMKFCYWLLTNPNLNTQSAVLTLRMARLAIDQCMPPSLVLAMDRLKDTSLEVMGPQLMLRLHDPRWEVRDSTLEVFAALAHLSFNKYPVYQEILVGMNCGSVAVDIAQGDAESYVRASAIQVIAAMLPVDALWNKSLAPLQVSSVMQSIVRNDSEAVVRREAVLLLTQLLKHARVPVSSQTELHQTMLGVSLSDLHWEVRVNAVDYWTQVIDVLLEDEGMVDGVFPPVTFSKATKKIVTLTVSEIQARIRKVLERLSQIGCLNALLVALQDDCDEEVAQKAAQAIKKFLGVLTQYEILPESSKEISGKRKCSPDRQSGRSVSSASRTPTTSVNADQVIDGIVNSSDLNLLAGVMRTDEENGEPVNKQAVSMITPDYFLTTVSDMNLTVDTATQHDVTNQLCALLDDVLTLNPSPGDNVPDCY